MEEHFPDFYKRSDRHSNDWQRRYLSAQKVQLAALLACAAVAAARSVPLITVLLFAVAVSAQLYRLVTKSDEKWWNGRAGAESVKTMAWRYCVGGRPFQITNQDSEMELAKRIAEVAQKVAQMVPIASGEHVTAEMRAVRAKTLSERIDQYHEERILRQAEWYLTKCDWNANRGTRWAGGGIACQGLGLVAGILAAVFGWEVDLIGLFAALGATTVAWVAVKQYETLARSYAVANSELQQVSVQITAKKPSWTEDEWSLFVDNAEEAISREHTSWRASRAA